MYAIRHAGMLLGRRRTCLLGHTVRGFLSHSSFGMERGCHVRASEPWTASSMHGPNIGPRLPGTTGVTGRLCATCSVFRRAAKPLSVASSAARRAMSTRAESQPENNLFEYTSGRWVYNEALRMKERTTVFEVGELRRLAAESVGQTAEDVVGFTKYAEGWWNRVFLVGLRDGRQVVARVPYPATVPKYLALASEVATIEYMRRHGIPAPEIYGYSPDADNAAGVPYILMEFVQGLTLSDVWSSLGDDEVISVVDQITQLEARMMALEFPAGGSLYFTKDLEDVAPGLGVPLADSTFCVGPDTAESLWKGRRTGLDVFRGPYPNVESALTTAAHKEIAYLERFGRPIQPLQRYKRRAFNLQTQSPGVHVELLQQYLAISPSLAPREHALRRFCIRHPDLQLDYIAVARSPGSGCEIVSLLDWQHASILPACLLAGIPPRLRYPGEKFSLFRTPPLLPEDLGAMSPDQQQLDRDSYRERLAHYHYVTGMQERNRPHYDACTERLHDLRLALFRAARAAWEGESHELKVALIQARQMWDKLAGWDVPCPLAFEDADLQATAKTAIMLQQEASYFAHILQACGLGSTGWVHNDSYQVVVAGLKAMKQQDIEMGKPREQDPEEFMAHWPWSDMDEDPYM